MKKFLLIPAFAFCAAQIGFSQPVTSKPSDVEMGFEENKGQLADKNGNLLPNVLFKSRGTGPGIYITTSGLTYVFVQKDAHSANADEAKTKTSWSKIEMNLENASIKKENIVCENELPGYSNFYYAHCPQGILNVRSFHSVTIKNIYPGIDWVFNADAKSGMAHDFIVHPGADPNVIRINYKGTNAPVTLDNTSKPEASSQKMQDAVSALINLGYKKPEIEKTVRDVLKNRELSLEDVLRETLRQMGH